MRKLTASNIIRLLVLPALSAMAGIFTVSCTPPEDPSLSIKPSVSEMKFSADGMTVIAGGSEITPEFTVETNQGKWEVALSEKDSWLKVSQTTSGFTLSADENKSTDKKGPITVTVTADKANAIVISVSQEPSRVSRQHNVYIAGAVEIAERHYVPGIWVDGELEIIGGSETIIQDMAVSDNNMYMGTIRESGDYFSSWSWYGGEFKELPKEGIYSYITGLAVTGGDVYVAGFDVYDEQLLDIELVYWKNGIRHPLGTSGRGIEYEVGSITVSNGDAYICGSAVDYYNSGVAFSPVYWKNGEINYMGPGYTQDVRIDDIAVEGDDVYVIGIVAALGGGYWKNERFHLLPYADRIGSLHSIEVVDGNVYVVGTAYIDNVFNAVYWKNGELVIIESSATALDIAVCEGEIYILGAKYSDSGDETVCYWINGGERVDVGHFLGDWAYVYVNYPLKIAVEVK